MWIRDADGQVSLFDPALPCGKTSSAPSPAERARTSGRSLRRSSGLKNHTFMLLDLRKDAGNILGPYWAIDPHWLGPPGTLNTSECPRPVAGSSLSQILLDTVPSRYYLSRKACLGILKRTEKRKKPLPPELETALLLQAGVLLLPDGPMPKPPRAFHINQREEAIDLGDMSGTLLATPNMQMQTFVSQIKDTRKTRGKAKDPSRQRFSAGFSAGAGAGAGSIAYRREKAPTLKGTQSGGMMPTVLCLTDQGGTFLSCQEEKAGTLRAQEHGHQPLVFENHGIDGRYTGPLLSAPTISARYGTGGNNVPLIRGSFRRLRTDRFVADGERASTQSARQYKDATDLILQGRAGPACLLIRRMVPQECERLQGFPDFWTELPKGSDTARYMALGNSVAVPCVDYLMRGIVRAIREGW